MPTDVKEHNKQVAAYWSWVSQRGEKGFWCLPGWQTHQNILASGCPSKSWLDVLGAQATKRIGQDGLALSIGCGGGELEPLLLEKGLCARAEACDISGDLVRYAQQQADLRGLPISYFESDLNSPHFEKNKYDLVIAAGILHHIENLEGLFANLAAALKPGGCFLIYDYVGPTRFQWTQEQIDICNTLLKKMPLQYRWKRGYPWYYIAARLAFTLCPFFRLNASKRLARSALSERHYCQFLRLERARLLMNRVTPPPPEQFIVTDPSEAVRSAEILPLLDRWFKRKELLPQGGTLVQPLFNRTVANFIDNGKGSLLAQSVLQHERDLIDGNKLQSDFIAALFQKKEDSTESQPRS